jgi:hypothetical protein
MGILLLSLWQYMIFALGVLMFCSSIALSIALLYFLIKVIERLYPDKEPTSTQQHTIAPVEPNSKPVVKEKVVQPKRNIEPSVPDDIPSFGTPPKIVTNFDIGSLGKQK